MRARGMFVLLGCVVTALMGCSSQDETIGQGPVALVFTNDGSGTQYVKVSWVGRNGDWASEDFYVYVQGRVELRLPERDKYYIRLTDSCSSTAASTGASRDRVITVGESEPVTARP